MKFCGQCGAPLRQEPAGADAELRHLTVLFCDLVGSTTLSEALDPEELRDVVAAYHGACEGVVREQEGHIAQYLGDGLLVYFGYPVAHEDAAHRAVRTGLGILAAIDAINAPLTREHGVTLRVRIGIHAGQVVVGDVGGGERREQLAQGKTPNLSARIQGLAEPDTVVISGDTHHIVRGFFDCHPLGVHDVKGLSDRVELFRVERESDARTRLDVARRLGFTPLVGRERERVELESRWHDVKRGDGHTVLLRGEAGIGKSRLVDTLRVLAETERAAVFESHCTPYGRNAALAPITGMLERTLGFRRDTTVEERRQALDASLAERGLRADETLALMGGLLGLPTEGVDPTLRYTPQKRRARTLEVLGDWVKAGSHGGAALWVVEDLHWADPTTLELISLVVGTLAKSTVLVVLTSRPDFEMPWPAHPAVSELALTRLEAADTRSIATRVAFGKALPESVIEQISARTEGVPLFVEEVTKAVLELDVLVEQGDRFELAGPLPADLIPSTLQDSLTARLDRLGPAKATAQLAATIGREFRYDLLGIVSTEDPVALREHVEQLVRAELVYPSEVALEESYLFKHALIQDAAYGSLLKKSRRQLHRRIASALTERFPVLASASPELVAEHFTAAAESQLAVQYWLQAGQLALSRSANHEAIAHLRRGLGLVTDLPKQLQDAREHELISGLIPALISTQGWAAGELGELYARLRELADRQSDPAVKFAAIILPIGFHLTGGRINRAIELCGPMLELAESIGDSLSLVAAHQTCTAVALHHAEYRRSIEHAERAMALDDAALEQQLMWAAGASPFVSTIANAAHAHWMAGQVERCLPMCEEASARARRLGHQSTILYAEVYRLTTLLQMGEYQTAVELGDASIRYALEERLEFWIAPIRLYRAHALTLQGRAEEALPEIREALTHFRLAGNGVMGGAFQTYLAEALWATGDRPGAFAALVDGLANVEAHDDRAYEPELYRLRGEFLLAEAAGPGSRANDRAGRLAAAEDATLTALAIARQHSGLPFELRALVTLCRVREALGRNLAADRAALAECVGRFAPEARLPELTAAKALLGETAR